MMNRRTNMILFGAACMIMNYSLSFLLSNNNNSKNHYHITNTKKKKDTIILRTTTTLSSPPPYNTHTHTPTYNIYFSACFQRYLVFEIDETLKFIETFEFEDEAFAQYPGSELITNVNVYNNNNTTSYSSIENLLEDELLLSPDEIFLLLQDYSALKEFNLDDVYCRIQFMKQPLNLNTSSHLHQLQGSCFQASNNRNRHKKKNYRPNYPAYFYAGYGLGLNLATICQIVKVIPQVLSLDYDKSHKLQDKSFYEFLMKLNLKAYREEDIVEKVPLLEGSDVSDAWAFGFLHSIGVEWVQCNMMVGAFPTITYPDYSCPISLRGKLNRDDSSFYYFPTNTISYLRKRFLFTVKDVMKLLLIHAGLKVYSLENIESTLNLVKLELGLTERDLRDLVSSNPALIGMSHKKILATCKCYKEEFAIRTDDLKNACLRYPALLSYSLENSIKPKLYYFTSELLLPAADVGSIVTRVPSVIGSSLETTQSKVNHLKERCKLTNAQLAKILNKYPSVLFVSKTGKLEPNLEFIEENLGLNGEDLGKAIVDTPSLLLHSIASSFIPKIKMIELALEGEKINNSEDPRRVKALMVILRNNPSLLVATKASLQARLWRSILNNIPVTEALRPRRRNDKKLCEQKAWQPAVILLKEKCKLSNTQLAEIFSKYPSIMFACKSGRLEPNLKFIGETLGVQGKKLGQVIVEAPQLLLYSASHSFVPRIKIIERALDGEKIDNSEDPGRRVALKLILRRNPSLLITPKNHLQDRLLKSILHGIPVVEALKPRRKSIKDKQETLTLASSSKNILTYISKTIETQRSRGGKSGTKTDSNISEVNNNIHSYSEPISLFLNKNIVSNKSDKNSIIVCVATGQSFTDDSVRSRRMHIAGGVALYFPQVGAGNDHDASELETASKVALKETVIGTDFHVGTVVMGVNIHRYPSRNRCSLSAIHSALRVMSYFLLKYDGSEEKDVKENVSLVIYTDSSYALKCLENDFIIQVQQQHSSSNKRIANIDLLRLVVDTYEKIMTYPFNSFDVNISFRHSRSVESSQMYDQIKTLPNLAKRAAFSLAKEKDLLRRKRKIY